MRLLIFITALFLGSGAANAGEQDMADQSKAPGYERAVLAGGCFWGMGHLLQKLDGVLETRVGYSNGDIKNPTYEIISTGLSGSAESVEIIYDAQKISYAELLKYFFRIHDPTTLSRQGNDRGTQYRSAIFYENEAQKKVAQDIIQKATDSGVFYNPVVTTLEREESFTPAEEYHQDYLIKNPKGYTCHFVRDDWKF